MKKVERRVKRTCRQKRYHDWVVVCVGGRLPLQELSLSCVACGATACVDISGCIEEVD